MKQILTFFFIFIGIFANARNITGIVLSDNDSTEVLGATCKLMSEGHIITVSTTGNNGEFDLTTDLKTKLEVEISMVGYNHTEILIEKSIALSYRAP